MSEDVWEFEGHRFEWVERRITDSLVGYDLKVDDWYAPRDLIESASEIEDEALWNKWVAYWMEPVGDSIRLDSLYEAQVVGRQRSDELAREVRRGKSDPDRLTPESPGRAGA